MKRYHTVLTIAGSDSGGGAGIQADIKTASACGCYVASVITALTAQNTQGVDGIHTVPASFVRMQAEAVLSDIGADAVKLGMLPTAEIVETVAEVLEKHAVRNVVLDPVMIATSGDRLDLEGSGGSHSEPAPAAGTGGDAESPGSGIHDGDPPAA